MPASAFSAVAFISLKSQTSELFFAERVVLTVGHKEYISGVMQGAYVFSRSAECVVGGDA